MKDDKQDHGGPIDFDPSSITTPIAGDGVMPSPTGSEFLYQSGGLNAEIAEQARQRGFIRVHKLVDAMAECAGWDDALPRVYRHLCCHLLAGAPETTEGRDHKHVWYQIMKTLMSDPRVDWQDVCSSVVPPQGLQPYEYADGQFVHAIRKPHYEFAQQFVKLDEFEAYMNRVTEVLHISLQLPQTVFPVNASQLKGGELPFPCGPGTRWEDITFVLKSDDLIYVKTPLGDARIRYDRLGFTDRRTGDKPNMSTWPLFQVFAKLDGTISKENPYYVRSISDNARRLNKHLKKIFGINESIYEEHYRRHRRYKMKFQIRDDRFE